MYNSALSAYVRTGLEIVGVVRAEKAGTRSSQQGLQSGSNSILALYIPECLALGHTGKGTAASLSQQGGVVSEQLSSQSEQGKRSLSCGLKIEGGW